MKISEEGQTRIKEDDDNDDDNILVVNNIIPHSSISNCPIPRKSFSFITEIYFRYNVTSDHSIKNDGGVFLFRTPQLDVEKCPGVGAGVISLHTAPTASTSDHIEVTCVTHHPRTFSSNVERRQH